jgi:hypothetical protein
MPVVRLAPFLTPSEGWFAEQPRGKPYAREVD